ncbi:fumarylacetoacetate hydrolase family protein [Pseudactinotalea sp. HY158]|uniref:fumarylacetoacetate hydrolase family protein n=1 Tax=Pseudactinotalea sp. HY158 TaxID=2654547 RepID=UPI00129C8B66|nr:fumarylacetoacetate hydrolase family protein [Pseudactinotalea sp. HY158]QGH68974.1 DUF2437 domain-containing protein [Pseudactinotalea sp. HY158]
MRIARFAHGSDPAYGLLDEAAGELVVLRGDPLHTAPEPTGARVRVDDVRLLAPVIPRSKVVGVGRNYAAHAAELGNEVPAEPVLFLKPNTAVAGPDDPIVLPAYADRVDYEAELAVVISRVCKNLTPEQAPAAILGYTAACDYTAREAQRADATWTRGKAWDTSCPLGPYLVLDDGSFDPGRVGVRSYVDGQLRQDGTTADMVRSVTELVAYASSVFTLLPGDVVLTGTPAGVGPAEAGRRVDIEIDGIGRFGNPIVRR